MSPPRRWTRASQLPSLPMLLSAHVRPQHHPPQLSFSVSGAPGASQSHASSWQRRYSLHLPLHSFSPPHHLHLCPQMPGQQGGHSKPSPMSHTHVLEGRIDVLEGNISAKAQVPLAQGWQPQAGVIQPPPDRKPSATTFLPSVPHAPCPASACLVSPCPLPPDTVTSACPFKNGIIIDIMIFGTIVKR